MAAEGSDFPDVPGLARDLQKMSGYRNRDHVRVHCADVSTFRGAAYTEQQTCGGLSTEERSGHAPLQEDISSRKTPPE